MIGVINIPALFATLAARVNTALSPDLPVYFDYGRYIEVTRNLTQKDGGITTKNKKYPLIWLVYPFTVQECIAGVGVEILDMQIIIATVTTQASTTPDRMAENFIPKLYPIYEELKRQIDNSGFFEDIDFENVHKRIDQPYWDGKDGTSVANLFNDFIDAIQLKNIRLKVNEETCDRFALISGLHAH